MNNNFYIWSLSAFRNFSIGNQLTNCSVINISIFSKNSKYQGQERWLLPGLAEDSCLTCSVPIGCLITAVAPAPGSSIPLGSEGTGIRGLTWVCLCALKCVRACAHEHTHTHNHKINVNRSKHQLCYSSTVENSSLLYLRVDWAFVGPVFYWSRELHPGFSLLGALKGLIRNTCPPSRTESCRAEVAHFHPEIQSNASEMITFQNVQPLL